ncbi:hypothetical protein EBU71_00310 [bacterium]|nr:hypothetical protein [Candidatus Elulimicrobium humile]
MIDLNKVVDDLNDVLDYIQDGMYKAATHRISLIKKDIIKSKKFRAKKVKSNLTVDGYYFDKTGSYTLYKDEAGKSTIIKEKNNHGKTKKKTSK